MDRDVTGGEAPERAGQRLLSAGSLASAAAQPRSRRRTVVLVLACAALLAGGFVAQRLTAHPETASSGQRASAGAPHRVTVTGRRTFTLHPGSTAADVVVVSVTRVPAGGSGSALEVVLRIDVVTGVETLTTETFAAGGPDGAAARPASAVTVLHPDAQVTPSNGGFRIAAPDAADVVVILDVPPGDHVVSILGEAAGRTPASFAVHG